MTCCHVFWVGMLPPFQRHGPAPQAERQRLSAIPGMLHPNELQEEMVDA